MSFDYTTLFDEREKVFGYATNEEFYRLRRVVRFIITEYQKHHTGVYNELNKIVAIKNAIKFFDIKTGVNAEGHEISVEFINRVMMANFSQGAQSEKEIVNIYCPCVEGVL